MTTLLQASLSASFFQLAFVHFVSLSHSGKYHNISNFFIIIVMVISDFLMLLLQEYYDLMKVQVMASIF